MKNGVPEMGWLRILLLGLMLSGCASLGYNSLEDEIASQAKERNAQAELAKKLKQHFDKGEAFYKAEQWAPAEAEFQAMLTLKPNEENALYRLGTLSFKTEKYDAAADYFERTIKTNPRNAKAHYNLASIRLMQSQNHYKYFAALAAKEQDLGAVTTLLGDIDKFNSSGQDREQSASLDKIAGALKK